MSFLNNIKRVFGFGSEESDDELYAESPEAGGKSPEPQGRGPAGSHHRREPKDESQEHPQPSAHDMALKIFDGVVEEFNKALPAFLANSVDPEAQKRHLLDSIDQGVKRHIENMHAMAVEECSRQWADEKNAIQESMNSLTAKNKEMESRTNEMRERQLSAERQKRALSDRVRDLEATIGKLEAEKEQYELEVKSMLNKVKVAGVHEKEIEDMRAELAALRSGAQPQGDPTAQPHTDLAAIEAAVAEATAAAEAKAGEEIARLTSLIDSKDKESAAMKAQIDDLNTEKSLLEEAVATLEMKDKMSSTMVNDMQSKCSDSRVAVEKAEKDLAEANQRIASLEKQLVDSEKQLEEARKVNDEIAIVAEQIEAFQQVKDKLEERIASLKQSLTKEKESSDELRSTVDSLNQTIRENLEQHAQRENEMQAEIDTLNSRLSSLDARPSSKGEERQRRRRRDKYQGGDLPLEGDTSDIDEILGDTDWLVSQPPKGHSMRPDPSENSSFGYQEPPRRHPHPDNDAQMSLF